MRNLIHMCTKLRIKNQCKHKDNSKYMQELKVNLKNYINI